MSDLANARSFLEQLATARIGADVDAIVNLFHDDVTFRIVGLGAPVTGKTAVRTAVQDLVDVFEFLKWTPTNVVVDGDVIASHHRLKVRHRPSGNVAETETAEFLSMCEGRCRGYVQFADTALIATLSRPPA